MENTNLKSYIQSKLNELQQEKDMNELTHKGKLSFGINARNWQHLPSWNMLVKQKKLLIKWLWINAFYLSLMVVFITNDIWDKMSQNLIKGLLGWIALTAVIMIFYVLTSYYSLFAQFRKTEREVRKLIYEDLLFRLEGTEDKQLSKTA